MRFIETPLAGAWVIEPLPFEDSRGFLTRTFSRAEFEKRGCNPNVVESNVSFNKTAGTLRGMHFQLAPYAQSKIVRCTAGAVWDCIIDLRRESPTFKKWFGVELTADNRKQLYIHQDFAHGFITLADATEVSYHMGNVYHPASARGVRWNDPAFGIRWPRQPALIIDRDATYPDFTGKLE
jgi:dTDP-4-dehydrorhamnose 3,5-epimerase